MRPDEFSFDLPPERIAQNPPTERGSSRLLLLDRITGAFQDAQFSQLPNLLRGDELLVLNNTRVLPARFLCVRAGLDTQRNSSRDSEVPRSGKVEVFLTRRLKDDTWEALVRPGKKLPVGERVFFGEGELEGEIVDRGELGLRTVRFHSNDDRTVAENMERLGHMPLPPYITRPDAAEDRERYQTVFAQKPGAVAAPTAGLHFTPAILEKIRAKGCEICEITLEVGLGTFQPVHTETLEAHPIHAEAYEISDAAAEQISGARREKRPVLAVGTTVVRALEDAALRAATANASALILSGNAEATIFLLPGHSFRAVDMLLTNFHLPQSTLLALVSAFAGRENVLAAYRHAVEAKYRFYSYGDCMLIR